MAARTRPLSPHLQIYRWYLSMALSIAHRATGIGLSVALIWLVWWLVALAGGESSFGTFATIFHNPFGGLLLFGTVFLLWFHFCTGIRHLAWDLGYGYRIDIAKQTGKIVIGATAVLTLVTWLAILIF